MIHAFLDAHGWGTARQESLAGDASTRRYIRLCTAGKSAILMVDPQHDTERFANLASHLRAIGLSAPNVFARSDSLMLLEDFGDAQFAKVVAASPELEIPLYTAATNVLVDLETASLPSDVAVATPESLGRMIEPAFSHYLPSVGVSPNGKAEDIIVRLTDALSRTLPPEPVLVLRDYHAENMIWLPERDGVKRVGLLDFQDALAGPAIYDLVSLLQDARRDVSAACHEATMRHYLGATGRTEEATLPVFHLLGLQRNLRILGVFARLASERNKPGYMSLIPRVWGHIRSSLTAPVARELAPRILDLFPEPTPERLEKGRSA